MDWKCSSLIGAEYLIIIMCVLLGILWIQVMTALEDGIKRISSQQH